MKSQISIAIPTWNRFAKVVRSVHKILEHPAVGEICVVDDCSSQDFFRQLEGWADLEPKVQLYLNPKNLDCYANKAQALRHCSNDFAILLDSDNVIGPDYIDRIFQLGYFDPDFSILPTFARPHFDYRKYAGQVVTRDNVASFMGCSTFTTALNTANFFVHRDSYLEAWDESVNPHTADSIYMNYRLLAAGKKLLLMDGLEYDHEVHDEGNESGSHYKRNCKKTGNFAAETEAKLRALT